MYEVHTSFIVMQKLKRLKPTA